MTARAFLTMASLVLSAQNPAPNSKPADYPAHLALPRIELGAEYLVQSIPAQDGVFVAKGFLVVEVAVFPTTGSGAAISADQFRLRINGKSPLYAQSPGIVAASLKYSDWERRRGLTASAEAGGVIVGPRPAGPRFPGDGRTRAPVPPTVGNDPGGGNVQREAGKPIEEQIAQAALPEGQVTESVKGCLFFPFTGKTASIRSVELIYQSESNEPASAIRLR